jgi:outer membrane protein assembly factor BamD
VRRVTARFRFSHARALIVATLLASTATGCVTQAPRANLNYGDRAHSEYDAAKEQFDGGDLLGAADAFRRIRREYGLSRWAWLAELRLADIDFRTEKYAEAIQGYRSWIRYHPTQPEIDYAHYMIARAYFAQIPNDWALVPASWERDQSSTHDAEDALQRFVRDYEHSQYITAARDYLRRTRELLARHEISVAEYYLSRNRPDAAIMRLQTVVETYPDSGLEPEALLKMGEVYLLMGRRSEARATFNTIVSRFTRSSFVDAARRYLSFIGNVPPAPPSAAPASGSTGS